MPGCVVTSEDVYILVSDVGYVQYPPWWCVGCDPTYYNVTAGTYIKFG